jgi:NAD dependent epimerase/dehydratase family enzyme
MGNGKQVYSWIHLHDLVNGMLAILENQEARGPYNFTAPEPATNQDFSRLIGRVLHRPSWIPLPAYALRLILGEMSTLILDGQRVVPYRLQNEVRYEFKYGTLESALKSFHPG